MKRYLFIPTFGNRPQPLIGRDNVISDFMEGLKHPEGHPNRATIFTGQRGTGKTAVLLEIKTKAEKAGYVTAFVTASERMLDEILQILSSECDNYYKTKQKIKGVNAGALGFSVGLTFSEGTQREFGFRLSLTKIVDELKKHKKGVLLIVDEVQSNTPEMRELAVTYQHLIGEGKDIAISLAGLPGSISSVLHDDILTFLNRAHKVELGLLCLNDISIFFTSCFKYENKNIDPDILDYVVKSTMGYPYLIQLVGYYILQYTGAEATIEQHLAEMAVKNARRDLVNSIHKTCLKPLSEIDKEFLRAMSEDQGHSRMSDIQKRMNVSQSYLQQYRKRLIAAGVISSEQRGFVEFAVPYLGEYLRGELE